MTVTYTQWLSRQQERGDTVGNFARFWRDLPNKPRLSSQTSIQQHLEIRGLFGSTPGLAEAFGMTVDEFNAGRAAAETGNAPLAAVAPPSTPPDEPVTAEPQQQRGHAEPEPQQQQQQQAARPAAMTVPLTAAEADTAEMRGALHALIKEMAAQNRKLDLICAALGIKGELIAGKTVQLLPVQEQPVPASAMTYMPWPELWELADKTSTPQELS